MSFRNPSSRATGTCAVLDCNKPCEAPDASGEAVCWRHKQARAVPSHGSHLVSPRKPRDGDRKAKRSSASRPWTFSEKRYAPASPSISDRSPDSMRRVFSNPSVEKTQEPATTPQSPSKAPVANVQASATPASAPQASTVAHALTPRSPAGTAQASVAAHSARQPQQATTHALPPNPILQTAQASAATPTLSPKPSVGSIQTSAAAHHERHAQKAYAEPNSPNRERQNQAGNRLAREVLGENLMMSPTMQFLSPRAWQLSKLDWELVKQSYETNPRTRFDINLLSRTIDFQKKQLENSSNGASHQPLGDMRNMSQIRKDSPSRWNWNPASPSYRHSPSSSEILSLRPSENQAIKAPPPGFTLLSNGNSGHPRENEYANGGGVRESHHNGILRNGSRQPSKTVETIDLTLSDDERLSAPCRESSSSLPSHQQRQNALSTADFTLRRLQNSGIGLADGDSPTNTNRVSTPENREDKRHDGNIERALSNNAGSKLSQTKASKAHSSRDGSNDSLASQKRKADEMVHDHLDLPESIRSPISPPGNENASSGSVSKGSKLTNGSSVASEHARPSAESRDDCFPERMPQQPPTPPSMPSDPTELNIPNGHGAAFAQETELMAGNNVKPGVSQAEKTRVKRIAKFNSVDFDSQIYAQADCLPPPPGVTFEPRKSTADNELLYLHANPAIHGMYQRSEEWHRRKSEEIAKRPRRKFWFGKVRERRQWLREQERQASEQRLIDEVAETKPYRQDPKPWSVHQHMDFGDVPEAELPDEVRSNTAWRKLCGRLREHRAIKEQMVQAYLAQKPRQNGQDSSGSQGAAEGVQKTPVSGDAGREENRDNTNRPQLSSREEAMMIAQNTAQDETDRYLAEVLASRQEKGATQGSAGKS